jgi:5-methylcytosine-specific restriction endonuclease McrA
MLTGLTGRRAKLDAEEAVWLREAKRRGTWMELGFATMLEYMDGRLGYGPRTARDRLRVAESLERLPAMTAALGTGTLLWSGVRELTRIATPKTEAAWIQSATGKNVREVQELVAGRGVGDLPDDKPRDDIRIRDVTLELTPSAFAMLRQARSVLEAEAGGPLSDDQLVEALCRRTLEGKADRAAHQVAITTCRHCDRGWQDGGGARVQLAPDEVERALCDAEHVGAIDDNVPTRAHQDIAPATRRFVLHRDGGKCVVSGCRSARNLDLHHVVSRTENGSHDASNLVTLCSAHHRALHAGTLKPEALRAHGGTRNLEHEAYAALVTSGIQKADGRKAVKKARSSAVPSPAAAG